MSNEMLIKLTKAITKREEIDDEEIDGLSQNHLDHNILPPTAMPNDTCCKKCNGSVKPGWGDIHFAIGQLVEDRSHYETQDEKDTLTEVIDWLRKLARE